jgi:hypothetical protein
MREIRPSGRANFPHPALRRVSPTSTQTGQPCLSPVRTVPSEAAESVVEVVGNMATLQTLGPFHNAPEVRLLPSTGVTRLPRYYGPVRLPRRPGLSLAGVRLVLRPPLGVSRVACALPVPTCRRHYPGGITGEGGSFPERTRDSGLPHPFAGSAPTFPVSRPAQRSLALRPAGSRNR